MIPIFLGSDITSEFKSEDGAIHVVERRCKINVEAPYLLKKVMYSGSRSSTALTEYSQRCTNVLAAKTPSQFVCFDGFRVGLSRISPKNYLHYFLRKRD